jgi:hypothetical protein
MSEASPIRSIDGKRNLPAAMLRNIHIVLDTSPNQYGVHSQIEPTVREPVICPRDQVPLAPSLAWSGHSSSTTRNS